MKGSFEPFYLSATDARQQRAALVLKDVDYIIEAHFELTEKAGETTPRETLQHHSAPAAKGTAFQRSVPGNA